ncbi:integrator complex subunit 10-like [Tropilaelaps mercedesae]|uniref:Integrator complex subunit 10 n=1 Tax=Tropilaelaps mercedesae TaxID=418985 RepID=A0A1V9X3I0_9ACAR|nr:integrator complex subunit 10-like [Tropilaelaps mercedesae]
MLGPVEGSCGLSVAGSPAEDYLIARSNCKDPFVSEAWLLTAKTLFPNSFSVQFAIYAMYKESQRYAEAASQLTDLLVTFGREPALWPEMRLVATGATTGGLLQESLTADFHATGLPLAGSGSLATSAIFAQLTPQSQYALLLAVCGRATDVADRCRCTLLLLRRFPDSIAEHGGPLIEELLATQRGGQQPAVAMQLRRLLVCDVLPLVVPRLQLPTLLTIDLLEHAIVHYVRSIHVMPAGSKASQTPPTEDPKELWGRLFELYRLVASKLKWPMAELLEGSSNLSEQQLARLKADAPHSGDVVDLSKSRGSSKSAQDDRTPKFYVTLVLFLRSAYFYGCYTAAAEGDENAMPGCVLPPGQLTTSRQLPADVAISLVAHFQIAVRCWGTLAAAYKADFERLAELLGLAEHWKAFLSTFFIDAAVYQNHLDEALQLGCKLLGELATSADWLARVKANLQMTSCLFATGDRETALTRLTETLTLLTSRTDDVSERPSHSSLKVLPPAPTIETGQQQQQQLCFVVCTRDEVLRFFIRILMTILKERLAGDQRDDLALGNLLVLSQADWPAHEGQVLQLIASIRRVKAFSYPLFMSYVVVPDILEEFAFLASDQHQELQLDLLPAAQGAGSRSRTVTRGVNKGAKEELRAAMEKQMGRANEDITQLIIAFLLSERHLLSTKR